MVEIKNVHDRVEVQETCADSLNAGRRKLVVMVDGYIGGDYDSFLTASDSCKRIKRAINDTVGMCIEAFRQTCSDCMSHSHAEPMRCRKCAERVDTLRLKMGVPR